MFRRRVPVMPQTTVDGAPRPSRRVQFTTWVRTLPRWQQGVILAVLILAAIGFVQFVVSLALFITSLRTDDLAIFLEMKPELTTLTNGQQASIDATLGVKNLFLCTADCTWRAVDLESDAILASGDVRLSGGEQTVLAVPIAGVPRGEQDRLVRVSVVCANKPSMLCKSTGDERLASAATRVQTRYTEAQQRELAAVRTVLPTWYNASRELDTFLAALVATPATDLTRRAQYRTAALRDQVVLEERRLSVQAAFDRDDFASAAAVLAQPLPEATRTQYYQDVQQEAALIAQYGAFAQQEDVLRAFEVLGAAPDVSLLRTIVSDVNASVGAFNTSSLADTNRTLMLANTLVQDLLNRSPPTIAAVQSLHQAVGVERTIICAIANVSCVASQPIVTLTDAATVAAQDCSFVSSSSVTFAAARSALLAEAIAQNTSLPPTATLAQAEASLGVPGIVSDPSFPALVQTMRQNMLAQNSPAAPLANRMAYPLALDVNTTLAAAQVCPIRVATVTLAPVPLPVLGGLNTTESALQKPVIPERTCCSSGSCEVCPVAPRTAVLFVHGFSFAQGTTPETNINVFGQLTTVLDSLGRITYLGHVFPQQNLEPVVSLGKDLPGRFGVTTTYYYDSYPQGGEVTFVAQKTENLETYSIRLREAVAVTKARTGADRVVIVAHSMGGLVTRRYLQLFGEGDVAAVIMVGTPNNGTAGRTAQFCSVFGSDTECNDLAPGSLFLTKLNAGAAPTVPVYTFIGVGCDGRDWDGIIEAASVRLPYANNTIVNGTCPSAGHQLHSDMLDPALHPEVMEAIASILAQY